MKKSKHKDREASVGNQIVPQQIKGNKEILKYIVLWIDEIIEI